MIKTFSILCVLLFSSAFQESEYAHIKSIPITTSNFFTTDNLGNCYIIAGTSCNKYDPGGNFEKSYSNKSFGDISYMDVHNPLKILIFYQIFQQIIFLDNMLAPTGNPISLLDLGYGQVFLACTSHNNGFWIYNQQNFNLIRFDQSLQKNQQTGNIIQLARTEISPNFLIEKDNNVFLNDSAKGILVFDNYGTYSRLIPIKGLTHFQVNNNTLFYFSEGKFKSYNLKTMEESETPLPSSMALDARTEKEKLYLLKQNSLDIYSVTK